MFIKPCVKVHFLIFFCDQILCINQVFKETEGSNSVFVNSNIKKEPKINEETLQRILLLRARI